MISILFLLLAIGCYTVSQIQQHGKLQTKAKYNPFGFWGDESHIRKYKGTPELGYHHQAAPNTWYYNFLKIKYKERFPLSATLLVFITDGYHLMQFFFFIFLSISVSIPLDTRWNEWLEFAGVWGLVHLIHFLIYKLLQR
jgi:hypothetical protein